MEDLLIQQQEDFDDSDYDYEMSHPELTEDKCPNKGCEGYLLKEALSDGRDDFNMTWTCSKCGDTWS